MAVAPRHEDVWSSGGIALLFLNLGDNSLSVSRCRFSFVSRYIKVTNPAFVFWSPGFEFGQNPRNIQTPEKCSYHTIMNKRSLGPAVTKLYFSRNLLLEK
jgi:hypothetical protein